MLLRVYVYSRSANKMVLNYCASYDTWLPEFEQPGGERDALSVCIWIVILRLGMLFNMQQSSLCYKNSSFIDFYWDLSSFTVNWLVTHKTLKEQCVSGSMVVTLKKRFFFTDQKLDRSDFIQLNLTYEQVISVHNLDPSSCTRTCMPILNFTSHKFSTV